MPHSLIEVKLIDFPLMENYSFYIDSNRLKTNFLFKYIYFLHLFHFRLDLKLIYYIFIHIFGFTSLPIQFTVQYFNGFLTATPWVPFEIITHYGKLLNQMPKKCGSCKLRNSILERKWKYRAVLCVPPFFWRRKGVYCLCFIHVMILL